MLVKSLKKVDVCHSRDPPCRQTFEFVGSPSSTPYWLGFSPGRRRRRSRRSRCPVVTDVGRQVEFGQRAEVVGADSAYVAGVVVGVAADVGQTPGVVEVHQVVIVGVAEVTQCRRRPCR